MKRKVALITILILIVPTLIFAQFTSSVERQYFWYAEEKLTVSNSVTTLSSEEYNYDYGLTRINVDNNDAHSFTLNEIVSDGTTGAMGKLIAYEDANAPSYIDIDILYNGLDSADFDANDTITGGTSGATCKMTGSYTRGNQGPNSNIQPAIAEIHLLDNSIIWTRNGATPVYSATDASCVGKKQYEGDTFYIFGSNQIVNFKAIRNGSTDAIIEVRYGL